VRAPFRGGRSGATFFQKQIEVPMMEKHPFGASPLGSTSLAIVVTACMVFATCGPLPARAAERMVLCEEFTNIY
jgi:hypothetical protein